MSKRKNGLIPQLRFPEFVHAGAWQESFLGDVTYPVNERNKDGDKHPIYSISNTTGFVPQSEQFVGVDSHTRGYNVSLYKLIKKHTFAYNPARINIGSLGYSGELNNVVISSLYVCFKTKSQLDDRFLLFFLKTSGFNRSVLQNVEGGIRSYLFYENFAQIKVQFPPIDEQKKIASCLSALDELVAANSQKLEMLKDHKKGFMQTLFPQAGEEVPKCRFPEFEKDGAWAETSLGEQAVFLKGKGIAKSDIAENGSLPCIRYGELYTRYNETISVVKSRTNLSADDLVLSEENDVIIPASGETQEDIATASCVLGSGIALGGDLNIIRTNINGVFLSYYINNVKKREIAQLAQGISVVHLYPNQLKALRISIPKPEEQQKIASCLSTLDDLIAAQTERLEQLKMHKKGLMQGVFPETRE